MRILFIFLFGSLLLVLAAALGTEVAALRHGAQPAPAAVRVVVRKARAVPTPRKSVHALAHRAG